MRVLFFVFSFFITMSVFSMADTLVMRDLAVAWRTFDGKGAVSEYVKHENDIVFFELSKGSDSEKLLIGSDEPVDIWMNERLVKHNFSGLVTYTPDSLVVTFGSPIRVTIYQKGGIGKTLVTQMAEIKTGKGAVDPLHPRLEGFEHNAYLMILTILVLFTGVYRRLFPISFSHSFQTPLTFKMRSLSAEESYMSFGSIDNLFTGLYFSGLVSAFFSYSGVYPFREAPVSLAGSLWTWLFSTLLVFAFVLLKYGWSRLLSLIFDFKGVSNIHSQDFVSLFILVMAVCLGISAIDFTLFDFVSQTLKSGAILLLVLAVIFYQLWIYFKFDKYHSHRKLMIIVYLCTTEFLPGFLIIYWLVKLQ